MARNRFRVAYQIQDGGACNIRALAHELVKAVDDACEDGVQPSDDSGVRLITHQIASLCRVDSLMNEDWIAMMNECKDKSCSSIYDVCNDYSLDPVEKPFKVDEYVMTPYLNGFILTHKTYDEIHYFIGPDNLKGRILRIEGGE